MKNSYAVNVVIRRLIIGQRNCHQQTRILPIKAFIAEVKAQNKYARIGCLDYGMKCIGVATTDETKEYAFPFGAFTVKQPPKTPESLQDLHRQLQAFSTEQNIKYEGRNFSKNIDDFMRCLCYTASIFDSLVGTLLSDFP